MQEVERTDGLECARRCVEALVSTEDFETRLALWKAAKRYHARFMEERTAGDFGYPLLPRFHDEGVHLAREL